MCFKCCASTNIDRCDWKTVGMVLCHTGIVRGVSRDGRAVKALHVEVNWDKLEELIDECKKKPGIFDVHVEVKEGLLMVGEEIMKVVITGDFRENVFPVMEYLVGAIKERATSKIEYYL
ncbi:MAG: molybdenum cofactor biosynthesis protein MoaE [Syntrophales bacterium]|nr:molybdenum cofactor biosynthesis protein MoaE [Syntrophales bacterium]